MKTRVLVGLLGLAVVAMGLVLAFLAYRVDTEQAGHTTATPATRKGTPTTASQPVPEPAEGTVEAFGDLDLPPKRPPPVSAEDDRGLETLHLGERSCKSLPAEFQAKVTGDKRCEVYLHDIARDGKAIIIMASPSYGVRKENGRPVLMILPAAAYPAGAGAEK